ncbi:hypothetical protein [Yoonia sp.]|uniref:hypothetical protein n=1 Tax=Yoonia sp. TaxID=2212373 RepID=UPI0019F61920|nr:hypothetical protein [Yoonia sp.]MBE0412714.1 hypothetical protein [Yoonia sp.]
MYKHLTIFFAPLVAIFIALAPVAASAEVRLLMAEEPGCIWCARWNAQIAPIYPKSGEGVAAPLLRVNIKQPIPDEIALRRKIMFTPTFVLLVDGVESGRIEGYPGEDFFWGLLGRLLAQENIQVNGES